MSKDKNKDKSKDKNRHSLWIVSVFHDERTRFIMGLIFLFLGALMALAFTSFLSNAGKADSSAIQNGIIYGKGANNWVGTFGAVISEYCINRWLGVASFLYVYFFLRLGYRLFRSLPLRPLVTSFIFCAVWSLWLSLAFGFFGLYILDGYQTTYIYLGGYHGYYMEQALERLIGVPGLLLFLIVTFLVLSVFYSRKTIGRTQYAAGFFARWRARRIAAIRARREAEQTRTEGETNVETQPEDADGQESDGGDVVGQDSVGQDMVGQESFGHSVPDDSLTPGLAAEGEDEEMSQEERELLKGEVNPLGDENTAETGDPQPSDAAQPNGGEPGAEGDIIANVDPLDSGDPTFTVTTGMTDTLDEPLPQEDYDPTKDLEYYRFPSPELLKAYDPTVPVDMEEQNANKERIRETLSNYGVEIKSISATVGPTITLFEIVLENGQRISKVRNLSDEIAMSIASRSGIRIIAPIPGKTAIGIEVPNKDPQTVSMRECIMSRAFQESHAALPVALGKTITNEVFVFDLAKAPHMLVAGATGQGKSVGLNAILTSLLYKKHPSQLKIVLVDPKMVEFSVYANIERHYLAKLPDVEDPIITDVTKVVATLKSLCAEMEDRYALLKEAGCRKLEEYNDKFVHHRLNPRKHIEAPFGSKAGVCHHYLPYIVCVVDEYGDLIMTAGKEVELPIARIAQKARAVGIHMIIATQRPSAKIVTGIIKANFPARMAFRVSSQVDSNIILDQSGAQNLIGRGDLFISLDDKFERVQCAFVDTPEVVAINNHIAAQQGYPTAHILPEPKPDPNAAGDESEAAGSVVDLHQLDPLFSECAELVVATGQGSTSMIQRKFGIGYTRAGRIMDQMEAAGIVGPYQGSKARAVLIEGSGELASLLEGLANG